MNRVKWKGPYIENNLLKDVKSTKLMSKSTVQTISKNSIILPSFTELSFRVYNGKTFTIVKITDEMIGHKLGEFVPTRTQFFYKKSKNT
jgi:ribosomal protein S19